MRDGRTPRSPQRSPRALMRNGGFGASLRWNAMNYACVMRMPRPECSVFGEPTDSWPVHYTRRHPLADRQVLA